MVAAITRFLAFAAHAPTHPAGGTSNNAAIAGRHGYTPSSPGVAGRSAPHATVNLNGTGAHPLQAYTRNAPAKPIDRSCSKRPDGLKWWDGNQWWCRGENGAPQPTGEGASLFTVAVLFCWACGLAYRNRRSISDACERCGNRLRGTTTSNGRAPMLPRNTEAPRHGYGTV